jgi:hypothetical protein
MSLKEQILNKIKAISDPELLSELNELINQAEKRKQEQVNEPDETYRTKGSLKSQGKKGKDAPRTESAIDYLEKIAEKGGVDAIKNPVEWQKKERRDRTLTIS